MPLAQCITGILYSSYLQFALAFIDINASTSGNSHILLELFQTFEQGRVSIYNYNPATSNFVEKLVIFGPAPAARYTVVYSP